MTVSTLCFRVLGVLLSCSSNLLPFPPSSIQSYSCVAIHTSSRNTCSTLYDPPGYERRALCHPRRQCCLPRLVEDARIRPTRPWPKYSLAEWHGFYWSRAAAHMHGVPDQTTRAGLRRKAVQAIADGADPSSFHCLSRNNTSLSSGTIDNARFAEADSSILTSPGQ